MTTASMPEAAERLLTAEEYAALPEDRRTELVKGRIEDVPPPGFLHGVVQLEIASLLREYVRKRSLGRVLTESGTVTARKPDTVRGPNVSFYSYQRLPQHETPTGYPNTAPDVVFEVLSPRQGLKEVLPKVSEYLLSGTACVCVIDPQRRTAVLYGADDSISLLNAEDALHLPAPLADWAPRVREFFPE
ncbi:MAG: Uma2 family endonuclease [Planctomycetota bacterium]|nr:Uma2 family endonuclease [Planctomycetaceae bacterium]MDQ3330614.1 Uma2 family endonuclease [Planctomycetota bacterium]